MHTITFSILSFCSEHHQNCCDASMLAQILSCLFNFYLLTYLLCCCWSAVLTPVDGSCYVSSPHDVMSSLLTEDSGGCGSPQTPWIVQVQQGQQINFTLIDFTAPSNASLQHSSRCRGVTTSVLSTCRSPRQLKLAFHGADTYTDLSLIHI